MWSESRLPFYNLYCPIATSSIFIIHTSLHSFNMFNNFNWYWSSQLRSDNWLMCTHAQLMQTNTALLHMHDDQARLFSIGSPLRSLRLLERELHSLWQHHSVPAAIIQVSGYFSIILMFILISEREQWYLILFVLFVFVPKSTNIEACLDRHCNVWEETKWTNYVQHLVM